jgi:DNA-directed RNA polymerase specialized sigma24 family protein
MSMASDDPAGARCAWGLFYSRHVAYLWAVCSRAYADLLGGEAGVADLVAETFRRAFERAETFDARDVTEPQRQQRLVRAWLGRIAQRLAQDVLRGRGRLNARTLSPEQWQEVGAAPIRDEEDSPATGDVALVREALGVLSDKEQLVLRVTMQWYRPGDEHQRLPNAVASDLAATLRTTPENLRQIRRRAMRKIHDYVAARRDTRSGGQP